MAAEHCGDSDTLACIAGSIAEPLFGVPQAMYKHEVNILKALFPKLQKLLVEFEKKYGNRVI
jgi:ADP-ribosylglycohydrolase